MSQRVSDLLTERADTFGLILDDISIVRFLNLNGYCCYEFSEIFSCCVIS